MIKHCSKSITADSLTGMIFAMEGIRGAICLLNGPMGCRFYHSTTSQFLVNRPPLKAYVSKGSDQKLPVDQNYLNNWFFRQPRVPNTYLDGYDYVYGTADKVKEALLYLKDHVDFSLLAIINSPGASLIGDNLRELAEEILPDKLTVMFESPGFSLDWYEGEDLAGRGMLNQIGSKLKQKGAGKKSVNLIGLSIWNRYLAGDKEELARLLGLCGISVNCVLFGDCTMEELENLSAAALNIVLYPEAGLSTARSLEELYGTPYYVCDRLPIGFKQTELFIREICERLDGDPSAVLSESERARALCYSKINDIYQMCGLPKGVSFCVKGMPSQESSYTGFLRSYLGMIPAGEDEAELVFSDANTIAGQMLKNRIFCGIEISLPGMGYTDIVTKTHMGIKGAMLLIEQVLNGLMSKL